MDEGKDGVLGPGTTGDAKEEPADQAEVSSPFTLGYASSFGITEDSELEPLTRSGGGPKVDNDTVPFNHSPFVGDD